MRWKLRRVSPRTDPLRSGAICGPSGRSAETSKAPRKSGESNSIGLFNDKLVGVGRRFKNVRGNIAAGQGVAELEAHECAGGVARGVVVTGTLDVGGHGKPLVRHMGGDISRSVVDNSGKPSSDAMEDFKYRCPDRLDVSLAMDSISVET